MAPEPATVELKASESAAEIIGGLAVLDANYSVVKIESAQDYALHGDAMVEVNRQVKAIDAKEDEFLEGLREAKRGIDKTMRNIKAVFDGPRTILARIHERISAGMTAYQRQQEALARAERDRLAAVAAAEQERVRKEAEKQAKKAEQSGDNQAAAMLRSSAASIVVPAPVVQTEVPRIAGLRTVTRWRGEVFDLAAFYTGIACGAIPQSAAEPLQGVIDRAASTSKGQLDWPGVRVVAERRVEGTGR